MTKGYFDYTIFSVLLVLVGAYSYIVYERRSLIKTLQNTNIENIQLVTTDDQLQVSFYIKETHPQAAAYLYIRNQENQQILIRDLKKIQSGVNSFEFKVEETFLSDLYLSIQIKSFYKEDWKIEEIECVYNRGYLHLPFIPELTLCYDRILNFPSFSLYTKD